MAVVPPFAALGTLFEYIRPSKSPYLIIIVTGCICLVSLARRIGDDSWVYVSLPIFICLPVLTILSFFSKLSVEENIDEQLKFSRAVCLASAIICLVVGSIELEENKVLFWVNYHATLIQLIVFVLYIIIREIREETESQLNFFQFSLVTSTYLGVATFCMTKIKANDDSIINNAGKIDDYFVCAMFFYAIWLVCQLYWARRVSKVVKINFEILR